MKFLIWAKMCPFLSLQNYLLKGNRGHPLKGIWEIGECGEVIWNCLDIERIFRRNQVHIPLFNLRNSWLDLCERASGT